MDSPMAVLLTYPLTVYYVITHLVPQSCKESRAGGQKCRGQGGRGLEGDEGKGDRLLKWPASPPVPELNIQNKQSLKIHVVEAGKEFDLVMVFWVSPSGTEGWVRGGARKVSP